MIQQHVISGLEHLTKEDLKHPPYHGKLVGMVMLNVREGAAADGGFFVCFCLKKKKDNHCKMLFKKRKNTKR